MAAKLLHSLSDDNPDLQKQIGCMTGIFQMFDRQHMIVSGRRIADRSHSHRMSLPRKSQYSNGSLEEDFTGSYQRQPAEMSSNKIASERQRFSTESSRASLSSSRSSSFSSVDYCRSHQPDPAYNDRITFPETASENSHNSMSPRLGRQSANIRDIVKDSMIKEARGLSNKLSISKENMSHAMKQRDALRDPMKSKTVDCVRSHSSKNVCKGLSNLHGTSWQCDEQESHQMQSDRGYKSNKASRVSYDGMETSRFSFESRETSTASKLRDLPRLSLDSRQCMMYQRDSEPLLNSQMSASLKRSCSTKEISQNMRQALGSEQRRSPSLVAKLMGLTALPDDTSVDSTNKSVIKNCSALENQILDLKSPSSKREPVSPRWVTSEMKPISSSMIHVEPAPWKKGNGDGGTLKQASRRIRSPTRHSNPFPSVYSEIEKKFKDIEFNQSGKNLRALKQILESIHAKGLLETEKHEQGSNAATGRRNVSALVKSNLKKGTPVQDMAKGKNLTEITSRRDHSSTRLESPIVIMKPISRPPRSETTKNVNMDQTVSSDEKLKYVQHSCRTQQQPKDNTASSPRNLGSVSPRTGLKKLDLAKQISAPSQSSDANKNRVQVCKQLSESTSPGGKLRPKSCSLQQSHSQIHEILLDIKKLRSQENAASLPLDEYTLREATRSERSSKINGSCSPSKKTSKSLLLASDYLSDPPILPVRLDDVSPEYHSPVSVLESSTYMDGLTMEENHVTTSPEVLSAGKSTLSGEHAFSLETSHKKLLSVDSLVQKLKRLNSTHDESKKDYIALLSEDTSPENRYISEILLASGLLLREFGSNAKKLIQLHPSGNLINPELFHVLEQTKCYDIRLNEDTTGVAKCHRKLIFDTLNEIITKKLASNGNLASSNVKCRKLAKKALNTKNLIKEVCADMEQLQPRKKSEWEENEKENDGVTDILREDVMQERSDSMMFECGVSEVVLDVERLIFKEMVDEIVMGDGVGCRSRHKSRNGGSVRLLKSRA